MGRPIARHEMVADMLLDMETEVAALRALVYRCTQLQDRILGLERAAPARPARRAGRASSARCATARRCVKWFGSERTLWVTRTAVQVHGGYGVVQDYDVERHYRDALILPIYEGTSQIQALMSLKDQVRWALERPWRLLDGRGVGGGRRRTCWATACATWRTSTTARCATCSGRAVGLGAMLRRARRPAASRRASDLAYALPPRRAPDRHARLHAGGGGAGRARAGLRRATARLAERFVHRALPLVRMHGEHRAQRRPQHPGGAAAQ